MEEKEAKKRGGRKPMTDAEKAAAQKKREEEIKMAENLKPEVYLQFQGREAEIGALIEMAKADFKQAKKRTRITELKLYVKPEEGMVYYVANGQHEGKLSI